MNHDIEKIMLNYQQQMKQLQEKLKLIYQNSKTIKSMITHRGGLIEQLQGKLFLMENKKIYIIVD
jgi:hypothetical protein